MLYAAYRGFASGSVYSWDIRSHIDTPLETFTVPSIKSHESTGQAAYETTTNQKMRFDIDPSGQLLSIGDQVRIISRECEDVRLLRLFLGWEYLHL